MTTGKPADIVVGVDHSAVSAWPPCAGRSRKPRRAAAASSHCGRGRSSRSTTSARPVAGTPQTVAERERRQLDDVTAEVRAEHPGVDVRAELVEHSAAVALEERSKTAAMLVLGNRSRGRGC